MTSFALFAQFFQAVRFFGAGLFYWFDFPRGAVPDGEVVAGFDHMAGHRPAHYP